jgi:clan AA aspartic protease (TIGR02281 family)
MTRRHAMRALALLVVLGAGVPDAASEWARGGRGGHEVRLVGDGAGWLVEATVNGRERGTFLLDTGATFCVVGPRLAKALRLRGDDTIKMQTANGIIEAPIVQLQSLTVGGSNARDLRAVVHDAVEAPLDGVIGLNFLNRFSYSIDPRRRVLELR